MSRFIEDFYKHPAGSQGGLFNQDQLLSQYNNRYSKISDKLDLDSCIVENRAIYIRLKMPSSVQGIFYDVVIKFKMSGSATDMRKMPIQLFSNSPSFIYTYGYTYSKMGLLIDELKMKYNFNMLKKPPIEKNTFNITFYDFSIYCLLRTVIERNLLDLEAVKSIQITNKFNRYYRSILHADLVSKERGKEKDKLQREKERAAMKAEWQSKTSKIVSNIKNAFAAPTKKVSNVKTTKTIKNVKKV